MIGTVLLIGSWVATLVCMGVALRAVRRAGEVRQDSEALSGQAERVLEEHRYEQDRLLHALNAVADGVIISDRDGATVLHNEAAERFRGARHSGAAAVALIDRLLERALGGHECEEDLSLFGPPREVLWVRAVPIRQGEELIGAAAFIRDISDMRRVDSVRRDFVANVSHELKTPIGALALLAETIANERDAEVMRTLANQVLAEADRLALIVDDLLDLSLIESQEAPLREQIRVAALVADTLTRVGPLASARGIEMLCPAVPDDLVLACDPTRVIGALTNLLENALKYSDPGTSVVVAVRRDGDRVAIEVTDEGIGIPVRDLERIFERFYRVDPARSRASGGTGLGLSIARHVARAHGGDIVVRSIEGEGSTFSLVLPLVAGGSGMAEAS